MNENVIVIDIAVPAFLNNRILDQAFASKIPGGSIWPLFALNAKKIGWHVMTADVYLSGAFNPNRAVCISNEGIPNTVFALVERGVKMSILWCGESPNVAWDFYHNLYQRAKPFEYACIFKGFHSRLPIGVKHHIYRWPNAPRHCEGGAWEDRNIAVMVTSPKQQIGVNSARLLSSLMWCWRWYKIRRLQQLDTMLRFPDLYEIRIKLIENLAPKSGFHLYGKGWATSRRYSKRINHIRFNHVPHECEDKLDTISAYRFTFCYENCAYPGYITEKIFDAMLAGTVPVYLGAPDIAAFVPSGCFIDVRDYEDINALWRRLVEMSKSEWRFYRSAIEAFLHSSQYIPFCEDSVATKFLEWAISDTAQVYVK